MENATAFTSAFARATSIAASSMSIADDRLEAELRSSDREHARAAADVEQAGRLELLQQLEREPRRRMRTRAEGPAGIDDDRLGSRRRLLPRRTDPEAPDDDAVVERAPAVLPARPARRRPRRRRTRGAARRNRRRRRRPSSSTPSGKMFRSKASSASPPTTTYRFSGTRSSVSRRTPRRLDRSSRRYASRTPRAGAAARRSGGAARAR